MSNLGFKGFAKPRTLDADAKEDYLGNVAGDEYVLYTGGKYGRRRASGRSAALATVKEVNRPLKLSTYVKRVLEIGFDTSISVGGLSLHQGAKPAVYLYLVKRADGAFVAKKAIPTPDPSVYPSTHFEAGDVVIPAPETEATDETKAIEAS
jgi:hypothetical protein